ncbi:MAG: histidinol-phosphatase [Bacteroidales bacterium]|nr:histidinol-phosphatase [Bacteroidales bacterium]
MLSNYHTHSHYCDGRGELREYVEYALAHGFSALGFSGHGPLPYDNKFSIKQEQYLDYCNEVRAMKAEYEGRIEILLGLEMDYIPGIQEDFTPLIEKGGLEYSIGSVHLVTHPDHVEALRNSLLHNDNNSQSIMPHLWYIDGGNPAHYDNGLNELFHGDIRYAVRTFFHQTNAMIERNRPTIVGHFDKVVMHNRERFFSYQDKWFQELLHETIALIRETGCICEINTRGIYKGRHTDFYPARDTIRYMNTLGIPVIVGTDAHAPADLDRFEGAYEFLSEIGYRNIVKKLSV